MKYESGGETAQSKQLGKGKEGMLVSKVSVERTENFCFCLDHPGQITLLQVFLPELRGQAPTLNLVQMGNMKMHPVI